MRIHCFVCASLLYPDDQEHDQQLHAQYLRRHIESVPADRVRLTTLQNGCAFPAESAHLIRNPIVKNVAYNWLVCDANCAEGYWMFLPEDCLVSKRGWEEIVQHMEKKSDCFALSKDPKALIGKKGIFRSISKELQTLSDMNCLGKEIGCVILRGELEQRGFHCISREWRKVSKNPDLWGNELYAEMNVPSHPNICYQLKQPVLQDYGFDGWKASRAELEDVFVGIVSRNLEAQLNDARKLSGLIAHHGPLITEVPFRGLLQDVARWVKGFTTGGDRH